MKDFEKILERDFLLIDAELRGDLDPAEAGRLQDIGLGVGLMLAPMATSPAQGMAPAPISAPAVGWKHYEHLIAPAANKYKVPVEILTRLLKTENQPGDPLAENESGAVGLAQFMPSTADSLGVNPRDPASCIDGAAKYLSQLKHRFRNWEDAIRAYNWGPGNVAKWKSRGGEIPHETQDYLESVLPG